jgi:hypothetical protein
MSNMQCGKCGGALADKVKFCPACGAPVAGAAPMAGGSGPSTVRGGTQAMPANPLGATAAAPDPFAQTVLGGDASSGAYGPPPAPMGQLPNLPSQPSATITAAPNPPAISPLAASVMGPAGSVAAKPWHAAAAAVRASAAPIPPSAVPPAPPPPAYVPTPYNAQPAWSTPAPYTPSRPPPYGPGALVLVHWADGNRYPGTVLQATGNQVLVAFPNGAQQWVDLTYISSST